MQLAFSKKFTYDRGGLLLVTLGMGLYLSSVTINQACVAQGQVRRASARWIGCAFFFIGWCVLPLISEEFRRVETGFAATAGLLLTLLFIVYRRPHERAEDVPLAGSAEELETRWRRPKRARNWMGEHDAELILVAGALLAAGIVGALLADRIRIPGLLLFLGLGMLAGSEGIGGIDFNDAELARTLGTIALVLILFEGGLTAGWPEIRPVLGTAASLATVGTVVTAVITGLAAKWIFGFGTLEGMLAGAAVAATDSAAIFAVLRRSTLEKPLARSLEGESGMNDPVALLLVIGFIEWIQAPGFGIADMIGLEALKLSIGIVVGVALGRLAVDRLQPRPLPDRRDLSRSRRSRSRRSPTGSPRSPTAPGCSPPTSPPSPSAAPGSRPGGRSSPSTRGSAGSPRSASSSSSGCSSSRARSAMSRSKRWRSPPS